MKKILLFTNKVSLKKYWQKILDDYYEVLLFESIDNLVVFLEHNKEELILMVDETSLLNTDNILSSLGSYKELKVLLFHNHPKVKHAITFINKGISGYENSYIAKENLLKMLDGIHSGNRWFFSDLTHFIINQYIDIKIHNEPDFLEKLTQKEKEIAIMIADGLTNKEIAIKESIALSTVKGHISHIFEKVGVSDRVTLALKFR